MKKDAGQSAPEEIEDLESWEPESIFNFLDTSRHNLNSIKKSLLFYNGKTKELLSDIAILEQETAAVPGPAIDRPEQEEEEAVSGQENDFRADELLKDILIKINQIQAEDQELRRDMKKKNQTINEYARQRMDMYNQISNLEFLLTSSAQKNQELEKELRRREWEYKKKLKETGKFEEDMAIKLEEETQKLSSIALKAGELTGSKYHEDRRNILMHLQSSLAGMMTMREEQTKWFGEMKGTFQHITEKWVTDGFTMPTPEEQDVNTMKRGSWIHLLRSWWNNESQTQSLAKLEELQDKIKELHSLLSSYENLLSDMNGHFERYKENEVQYTSEMKELKEQIRDFIKRDEEYLQKTKELEAELADYKEQNLKLGGKVKEMEQRDKELKTKVETMKKRSAGKIQQAKNAASQRQDQDKMHPRQNQNLMGNSQRSAAMMMPPRKPESAKDQTAEMAEALIRRARDKARNDKNQNQDNKMELIQKYYPQAKSQSSVFNPFKN
ncbi:hypothetical protein ACQCVO_05105 [Bacillus infantis]|uniref:hypothetical protein n=1 Tax=Bacillus infantis TaxID=324767 RepID=UPI003CE84E5B